MKKQSGRGVSTGLVTIVAMLAIVSMAVLAVLSLSTARQEQRLAEKSVQAALAYWQTDADCARLTDDLIELYKTADTGSFYNEAIAQGWTLTETETGFTAQRIASIDENRDLLVRLELGAEATVTAWRVQSPEDSQWTPDDQLPVYAFDITIIP